MNNLRCDGCGLYQIPSDIGWISALGYQMRYCAPCREQWQSFQNACRAEGARMQRLLDLWEIDTRHKTTLLLTPLDLPPAITGTDGQAVTLG